MPSCGAPEGLQFPAVLHLLLMPLPVQLLVVACAELASAQEINIARNPRRRSFENFFIVG